MKKLLWSLLLLTGLCTGCDDVTYTPPQGWVSSDLEFEPNEIDVTVTEDTDVIYCFYYRSPERKEGYLYWDHLSVIECRPESTAQFGVHYTCLDPENILFEEYGNFLVYFNTSENTGCCGLRLFPENIKEDMKIVFENELGTNATMTINLHVPKDNETTEK